ncbi:MAG: hypothetical protein Phog2KO_08040 [Phototrophicaceae bacterium]
MRLQRYGLILLAFYVIFIVGGYASNFPEIRWFNHILMTVLPLSWLGWRIKNQRGLPPSPLNLALIAMITLGFLTVPFSYDPRMALENMWQPMIFAIVFLFIVNSFHRAQNRLIVEILFLVACITILLSAIQVSSVLFGGILNSPEQAWINFLGTGVSFPVQTDLRIFLPLGVSTQVAGFVAPLIIICLTWALSVTKASYRYILAIITLLLSIILILTFSRGGLIAVSVGLFSFFILRLIQSDRISTLFTRRNLMIIFGLVGLMAVVGVAVLAIGSQSGRRSGDSVRLDLWQSAIEMTVDNPVTGVGTGLYGRALREYRQLVTARDRLSTAHNIYLTVTAENGLGVLLILLTTIWLTGQSWWKLRQNTAQNSARWLRLNGMMAALIAFAIHNMFDTLTVFANMLLFSFMIIYCTVEPAKSRLEARPQGNQILAGISFMIILAYGIWFVAIVDPAHRKFNESLNPENEQLALAQEASQIDPYLNLYRLQVVYLIGEDALNNPTPENLETAIQEYEDVLVLEPTWDTGMINLASLYEANNNLDQAQAWLDRARNILPTNTATLHWARIAELNNYEDEDAIISAYVQSIRPMGYLPLSDFWTETPLRQQVLERYTEVTAFDRQYRITRVHFPEQVDNLVPENPETASEWWVVGEHALTVNNDSDTAITAFTNALNLSGTGVYYASRARAYIQADELDLALADLKIARFLGAGDEYINTIQASIATDPEEIEDLRIFAIPAIPQSQDFEGVLFAGRRADFAPYRPMRFIGRGTTIMQVWLDLAQEYEAIGDIESAITVYNAITYYTPENDNALQEIERLQQ